MKVRNVFFQIMLCIATIVLCFAANKSHAQTAPIINPNSSVGANLPPIQIPLPDITPISVNKPLYDGINGTFNDGNFTYLLLNEAFCLSLPELTAYSNTGSLATASHPEITRDRRVMKLTYALPDMTIYYKNIGTASTGTGFIVQISTGSTVRALLPVNALAAGATGTATYGRGTAQVFRFPGAEASAAVPKRQCFVRKEANNTYPSTFENPGITIKTDNTNVVVEKSETNNILTVTADMPVTPN